MLIHTSSILLRPTLENQ